MAENIFKRDNLKFGLLLGFIAPFLSLAGYYFIRFRLFTFKEYLVALKQNKPLLTGITIPCLLLNIVLFTIYTNTHRDGTAKGIFVITIVYAIASLLLKFFG